MIKESGPEPIKDKKGHLWEWSNTLSRKPFNELYDEKGERRELLESLGLPVYDAVTVRVDEFAKDPDNYLNQVNIGGKQTERFHLVLYPIDKSDGGKLKRAGKGDLDRNGVLEIIQELDQEQGNRHEIRLEPYKKKKEFSGTIRVAGQGEISAEFIAGGEQEDLSRGRAVSQFLFKGKQWENIKNFEFASFGKEPERETRETLERSIAEVQKAVKKAEGMISHDGYVDFELFYIKPDENAKPEPIFFDVLNHSDFQKETSGLRFRDNEGE